MTTNGDAASHAEALRHLNEVRAEALEHTRLARQLAAERRDIIRGLIGAGFSQADLAREMGVTRQAVQKMLSL
jgi:DNA-directed RNA polymerase specialized sigma24 family protein